MAQSDATGKPSPQRVVDQINALEPEMKALSEDELKRKTADFRRRLDDGTEAGGNTANPPGDVLDGSKKGRW